MTEEQLAKIREFAQSILTGVQYIDDMGASGLVHPSWAGHTQGIADELTKVLQEADSLVWSVHDDLREERVI
jgi:hypothetical protein